MVGLCVPETGSGNRWRLRCFLVRILLLVGAQGIKDGAEHLSRPLVSFVMMRPTVHRGSGASVPNNAQASLDVVKEIRNRIQLVCTRSEGSEDGKVNKNDRQQDRDNIYSVLEEGGGGGVGQSDTPCFLRGCYIGNILGSLHLVFEDI